jgi:hypothetical protein
MANQTAEGHDNLGLLIELVEKEFKHRWHLPVGENMLIGLLILVAVMPMAEIFIILNRFGGSIASSDATAFLLATFALTPAVCAILLSSMGPLQENTKVGKYRRISKILKKDSKYKSMNNTRCQVIICSLIEIRSTVDVPLNKLRKEMPQLVNETKLLSYLFERS